MIYIDAWNGRPPFCCGVVLDRGVVCRAAPIVRRMFMGETARYVIATCERRRWNWVWWTPL